MKENKKNQKKIAVMTWHHVSNYGTALQALALKLVIEKMGCSVDFIDYRRKDQKPIRKLNVRAYLRERLHYLIKQKKTNNIYDGSKDKFEEYYEKNFSYTRECEYNEDFLQLGNQYDGFVCGSDQIWGPEWLDGRYFLDFVDAPDRKIAYAPSIGVSKINDPNIRELMGKWIEGFGSLSVREKTGCELIKSIWNIDPINALDPVALLTQEEWKKWVVPRNGAPYLFAFFLKNNNSSFKATADIARQLNLEMKVFHCTQSDDNKYANIDTMSPLEFLSMICNADYICTDSFHAMVFSVIFNKQFSIYEKKSGSSLTQESRIKDFLKTLKIEYVYKRRKKTDIQYINYDSVNDILANWRRQSLQFLGDAIQKIPDEKKSGVVDIDECGSKNQCINIESLAFTNRCINAKSYFEKRLCKIMAKYNFACKEECYRCKYFLNKDCVYLQKPVFYGELQEKLEDKCISTWKIYKEYYMVYDLLDRARKIRLKIK